MSIDAARDRVAAQLKVDLISPSYLEDNAAKLREIGRTFIFPTPEMYTFAVNATLGDDVYSEPTMLALEAHMAKVTGKEAALFMPSGTMSNQIALRTHLHQPPYTILCDHRAHIYKHEAGGAGFHSGAAVTPVIPANGHHLTLPDVQAHSILSDDIHIAPTKVISLENTLNGTIFPQEEIIAISEWARANDLKMHLDGARIWHVAAETGSTVSELCTPFDTVSLCFSKGLGAPIGSCLVGPAPFIRKARWFRKLFGGGMRQTGVLAGAAAYALTHNFPKLAQVHALARTLEEGLREIGVRIMSGAETCMVFYDPAPIGTTYDEIADRASELEEPLVLGGSRLVVHIQTTPEAVQDFLSIVRSLKEEKAQAGFVPSADILASAPTDVYVRRMPKNLTK
ncbi:pyridoxal phosphate-dependent transferase [Schizophyllum commune]